MFGQLNTRGFPSLCTYEQAARYEARIKPIRGRTPEVKPLADRKRPHYAIRRVGEDIMVRVHHTDIITFKPDGSILLNTGGWNTHTTHSVMNTILSWSLQVGVFDSRTWIRAHNADGVRGNYQLRGDEPTRMTYDPATNHWTIHNPDEVWVHKVNRKAINAVRKRVAPFKQTLEAFISLRRESIKVSRWDASPTDVIMLDGEAQAEAWAISSGDAARFMLGDDPAEHYKAMLFLLRGWGCVPIRSIRLRYSTLLLELFAGEVLTKVLAPVGKQVKDRHYRYAP